MAFEVKGEATVGRAAGCEITLDDTFISQMHARLSLGESGVVLEDLGSTNGTWVNNQRVTEAELQPGDLVRVGFTELEFLGNPEPAMPVLPTDAALAGFNPSQTIAFRAKDLRTPPPAERRKRFRDRKSVV